MNKKDVDKLFREKPLRDSVGPRGERTSGRTEQSGRQESTKGFCSPRRGADWGALKVQLLISMKISFLGVDDCILYMSVALVPTGRSTAGSAPLDPFVPEEELARGLLQYLPLPVPVVLPAPSVRCYGLCTQYQNRTAWGRQ